MTDFLWWRDGVIYHIYPRSFFDSTGNGLGDLPGIASRLDYLTDLGVDALWLSPIYPSPDADFGYDVSNYTEIDPRYGSLADFDQLLSEAHQRGLRIILDLVLNHSSDQHPWFLESHSSRDNPKADWYIWRDRPNNWSAVTGGSAWSYAEERDQYYLHSFIKQEPDLNWRNSTVKQVMFDVVRYWLERGVDGFRLDMFNVYFKDARFRDNPPKFGLRGFDRQRHIYDTDQPEMLPLLSEFRAILDEYPERYAVGETHLSSPEKAYSYCGPDRLHSAFVFFHNPTDIFDTWSPADLQESIMLRERVVAEDAWPSVVLSNHDMVRAASRYAQGEDDSLTKVFMAFLLTLRGTPYMYYGEEIGMRNIKLRRRQILDPPGRKYWPLYKGRDGCRSPMQWDYSPNAGFSSGEPWLPVHPNYPTRNTTIQREDPASLLNFTRALIRVRKQKPALQNGEFIPLSKPNKRSISFLRRAGEQTILVALNFSDKSFPVDLPSDFLDRSWRLLFSTHKEPTLQNNGIDLELSPYAVLILERG